MASQKDFIEFLLDGISPECEISYRKMFSEYAIYSKGKVVALVCDDQLFVKPTPEGKKFIGDFIEGIAYPGAKPSLLIENLEDKIWLSELFSITEKNIPEKKKSY